MFRNISILTTVLALTGCAVLNGNGTRVGQAPGSLGSDLRVFLDDSCLPPEPQMLEEFSTERSLGFMGVLGDIAVGASGIAFKSFGRFLEEAGSPRTSGTTGIATNMFFADGAAGEGIRTMNRQIKCVHIVRDGFASSPVLGQPSSDFEVAWADLGLTSEPSMYAVIELEPASDLSANFRGTLVRLLLNRTELIGAEGGKRDVMLFLEFSSPAAGASMSEDQFGNKQVVSGGPFAIGMIPLPGVEKGRIQTEVELKGLQTAWMNAPPANEQDGDFAFNLYVDVVEMKRGNPMMADIGRMLQSEAIVSQVEHEVANVINPEPRRRERAETGFSRQRAQRRMVRDLEDAVIRLQSMLDEGAGAGDILSASRKVDDAILDIEELLEVDGWEGDTPDREIRRAEELVGQADRVIE